MDGTEDRRFIDTAMRNEKIMMYLVNSGLLLAHIIFEFLFTSMNAELMFMYNFVSIGTYVMCFYVIHHARSSVFAVVIYSEIFIFMVLGTVSLGWGFGFHQYCYGFVVSALFADFFLGARERMRKRTYIVVFLVGFSYLGLRIWTWHKPYLYPIESTSIEHVFYLLNAVFTLLFIAAFIIFYAATAYRMQRNLNKIATCDMLTGLTNRRHMHTILSEKVSLYPKNKQPFGVAIFDIDFFKKVNDTYGHDAGDEVLKTFARQLENARTDILDITPSRWGGEEFLLLFSPFRKISAEQFSKEVLSEVEQIRLRVKRQELEYKENRIHITMTAGVAFFEESLTESDLFKIADDYLYYGKEHGRDQVVSSIPDSDSSTETADHDF